MELVLKGMLSTVDLLVKKAILCKNEYKKKLILTSSYKEINSTEPSPSVRVPWVYAQGSPT